METFYSLNQTLFFEIFNLSGKNPFLDNFMVFSAEYLILIMVGVCFFLMFNKDNKNRKALILTLLSLFVGFFLLQVVKLLVYQERPFLAHEINPLIPKLNDADSFPSDHTLISSIIAISYLYYRVKIAIFMIISALLIGISRIYVGVHYPLDILGGILIGLLAVSISWNLKKVLAKKLRI